MKIDDAHMRPLRACVRACLWQGHTGAAAGLKSLVARAVGVDKYEQIDAKALAGLLSQIDFQLTPELIERCDPSEKTMSASPRPTPVWWELHEHGLMIALLHELAGAENFAEVEFRAATYFLQFIPESRWEEDLTMFASLEDLNLIVRKLPVRPRSRFVPLRRAIVRTLRDHPVKVLV